MPNYAQVNEANKVHTLAESPNKMIEVETLDDRLLGTYYVDGDFVGYNIRLTSGKESITADGVDEATITATIYSWDETIATDYPDDIIFDVNGIQVDVAPVSGVATIPFLSDEAGTYQITAIQTHVHTIEINSVEVEAV